MEKLLYTYFWKKMPVVFVLERYLTGANHWKQLKPNVKRSHGWTFGGTPIYRSHININLISGADRSYQDIILDELYLFNSALTPSEVKIVMSWGDWSTTDITHQQEDILLMYFTMTNEIISVLCPE